MQSIEFLDRHEEHLFFSYRNEMRREIMAEMAREAGYAPFDPIFDRPDNVVDGGKIKIATRWALETSGLEHTLPVSSTPWSVHFCHFYMGQLGWLYADKKFPDRPALKWEHRRDYVWGPANATIQGSPKLPSNPDIFSPSEKYDLLVGDTDWGLTRQTWQRCMDLYDGWNGRIPTWMGICEGWAAASYALRLPAHAVKIKAANGRTMLTFYPADIKALASRLWASPRPASLIRGASKRCGDDSPRRDSATGPILQSECFDTNPATWHLVIVNQIGLNKRSFVMDASWSTEVWNQPVYAYRIRYFNPQKLGPNLRSPKFGQKAKDLPAMKLKDAIVPR